MESKTHSQDYVTRSELSEVFKLLRTQGEALVRIETTLKERPICPSPGLCTELEKRTRQLEDARLEAKAERRTLAMVASFLGGMLALVGSWLARKIGII